MTWISLLILIVLLVVAVTLRHRKERLLAAVSARLGLRDDRVKTFCGYCKILTKTQRHDGRHLRCWRCGARFYPIRKDEKDVNLLRLGVTMRTGLTASELSRGERRRWVR